MYFIIMVYILLRPLGTSSINRGGVCLRTPYIKQKKCQLFVLCHFGRYGVAKKHITVLRLFLK